MEEHIKHNKFKYLCNPAKQGILMVGKDSFKITNILKM